MNGVTLHGAASDAVIDSLLDRTARLARGERRDDGRRLGLVVEGGAMAGVFSGGAAVALARLGMSRTFDDVFATSAGVMNAAYFLTDQPDIGISVYYDDLATWAFIHPGRLWKILDVDYVMNDVVARRKPLDVAKLRASPSRFHVAVTDCTDASARMIDAAHGPVPTLTALKAAIAMPVLYNRTVMIDGRPCMDGGLLNPFPLHNAIAAGCTDILVLLSYPADYVRQGMSWGKRLMFDLLHARGRRAHAALLRDYATVDAKVRRLALGDGLPPGVRVATLCPDAANTAARSHLDRDGLWHAATRHCELTLRAFGRPDVATNLPRPGEAAALVGQAG